MATAKILSKAIRIECVPPVLLVHVEIDCEACGEYSIVLLGHHVQALIQTLQEIVDHEPELTAAGDVEVLYRRLQTHTPGLN